MKNPITVQTTINAPISKVWDFYNNPKHIVNWAFASEDWEAPAAENDVQVGGKFKIAMAAKDKSASFDFEGVYTTVKEYDTVEYDIADGRHVKVTFRELPEGVQVTTTFDPENDNTEELQRAGWQAIADNFKKYVESN